MATQPGNGGQPAPQQNVSPQINAFAQYVKDFSFENPNAPQSLIQPQGNVPQPQIDIQVNVGAKQLQPNEFEVDLTIEGRAGVSPNVLFNFELVYSGVFRFLNIPQEHIYPAVMIECPRLLFPFARQIISDAVRNGGYPPLYLDPIDFVAIFNQKVAEAQAQAPKQA